MSALQRRLGLEPVFHGGRRVTSEADLEIVRMVLSGTINKRLVAMLLSHGVRAAGISGEDAMLFKARATDAATMGRVGGAVTVDPSLVLQLRAGGFVPVVSPLARDADDVSSTGSGLNVNGDDAAAALAGALAADELVLVADVAGVLDNGAVIPSLELEQAESLRRERHCRRWNGRETRSRRRGAAWRRGASANCRTRWYWKSRGRDPRCAFSFSRMRLAMTSTLSAAPATDALLGVYRRPPMEFVRGAGVELFDADGKAYLDFVAGIAVNALGYGDEGLERAMREAIDGSLIHVSNLYRSAPGERLAERLVERTFADRVFFCNSGAEANEGAFQDCETLGARATGARPSMRFSRFAAPSMGACSGRSPQPIVPRIARHSVRWRAGFPSWNVISKNSMLRSILKRLRR